MLIRVRKIIGKTPVNCFVLAKLFVPTLVTLRIASQDGLSTARLMPTKNGSTCRL
jgi:hypothetical protein